MPLYLIYGDESYLRKQAITRLRTDLIDPAFAALSHTVLERPSIPALIEAASAVSFNFGNQTLLEVHECPGLDKTLNDSDSKWLEGLKDALTTLEPTKHVAMIATKADKKLKLTKWLFGLEKTGQITVIACEPFAFYKTDEAAQWLIQEAHHKNIGIRPAAAHALVAALGVGRQPLVNELEKLAIYAAERDITEADVATLSGHQDNVFALLEIWLKQGPASDRLNLLEEILLKTHPVQIFGLLQSVLDNAFSLKFYSVMGESPQQIAEKTKKHPFKVKKDLDTYQRVSLERLTYLKQRAVDMEWKAKTGQLQDRLALEVLLSQ